MDVGDVLLDFPELLVAVDGVGVFLPVDHALLKPVEGFGPRQRMGFDAPRAEGGKLELHGGNADLQALEVGHRVDGLLGVGDDAVAAHKPRQGPGTALLGDGVGGLVHERFIAEQLFGVGNLREHVRQDKHPGLRREGRQVPVRQHREMDLGVAELFDVGLFVAERAAIEGLYGDRAVGFLLDDLLELVDGDHMQAALRVRGSGTDGHLLVFRRVGGAKRKHQDSRGEGRKKTSHAIPPLFSPEMEMMLQTGTKPVSPCGRFLCFVPAPDGPPTFRHGAALYRPLSTNQLSNAALASTVTDSSPAEREGGSTVLKIRGNLPAGHRQRPSSLAALL